MERKEAAAAGLKKYNTNRPCKYGHIADRYVESGACSDCLKNMAIIKHLNSSELRERILAKTQQIYLFVKLESLAAIKMLIDDTVLARLPDVSAEAVNPEPYWKKQVSRETYQIKVRVPFEDVAAIYSIGKLMLGSEITK